MVIGLMILAAGAGCSFDRKWRALKREERAGDAPQAADRLAGRWDGRWISDVNGHSGRLRAVITPAPQTDTPEKRYHADFDANFMGLMRFGYDMTLIAAPAGAADGNVSFRGEEDLGKLAGGVYRYNGTADGATFNATYESADDKGRFQMTRPAPGK
jgi:hypothetical protein